jgi:mitochondrial import inner membrane translocase subunit TIM44
VTDRLVSYFFSMLPRHFRGVASARTLRTHLITPHNGVRLHPNAFVAQFHTSRHNRNELPKSPFQTFVEVLKDELRKNRELQENVKQLQGDVDKFQDSEAMKRARAAYERARVRPEIPSAKSTARRLMKMIAHI